MNDAHEPVGTENGGNEPEKAENTAGPKKAEYSSSDSVINNEIGSYLVPVGWFESLELSSGGKYFYLKDGTSLDAPTSNISVGLGENRYEESAHEDFRTAILSQLSNQVGEGFTVHGEGRSTEQGYVLYVFTIESDSGPVTTKQYYIVGDYKFVLVHETDYQDENIQDVDDAAQYIVNSFIWNGDDASHAEG